MFSIIKTQKYLFWNYFKNEWGYYNAKPLTVISSKFKNVPVEDDNFLKLLSDMNLESWCDERNRILNPNIAVFLFPNLATLPLN